jgi:hypothetical protein
MTTYGTGPVGYKKYCEERLDFIDTIKKEKMERLMKLGKLSQLYVQKISS